MDAARRGIVGTMRRVSTVALWGHDYDTELDLHSCLFMSSLPLQVSPRCDNEVDPGIVPRS